MTRLAAASSRGVTHIVKNVSWVAKRMCLEMYHKDGSPGAAGYTRWKSGGSRCVDLGGGGRGR